MTIHAWVEDEFSAETEACDWCDGIGYIYRNDEGIEQIIPREDLKNAEISARLETLEQERLREMGYSGEAKKPWEQDIRKGTQGGLNPYEED